MFNKRVARGAALLNEKYPGWQDRIDTEDLDINNVFKCILGQLFGYYFNGLARLFPDNTNPELAIRHGFQTDEYASRLTEKWVKYIEKYRKTKEGAES